MAVSAPPKRNTQHAGSRRPRAADVAAVGGLAAAAGFVAFRRTRRRLLPIYWAGSELAVAGIARGWSVRWTAVVLAAALVTTLAGVWRARSFPVRLYRLAVAGAFGLLAVVTAALGFSGHLMLTLFGPTLAAVLLGWPWWYELRSRRAVKLAVPATGLAEYWRERWRTEVVERGICAGTRLSRPRFPRPGVMEADIILDPGTRPSMVVNKGPEVEVCLDLNLGSVGWRTTERAAKVELIVVERSHIEEGVPWTGPTYDGGRCEVTTFADGTPGYWTFYTPGLGTSNGLIVGSTRSGKSRAGGVLIENLLDAGWMVAVGDAQGGQSLPAWRNAVEYHAGVDAVDALFLRTHAEVMRRSELLAEAGVEVFDEDDPRVRALGLRLLAVLVDECHLSLRQDKRALIRCVEEVVALDGKTGVAVVLLTQLPQMASLGGSIRIRDAAVAGNALVLRLSNRGSGTTILPDDFVGDPFAIPKRIRGNVTAGMGYLRDAEQLGMLSRVPMLDEVAAAARRTFSPVEWRVPLAQDAATTDAASAGTDGGAAGRLRAAFGMGSARAVVEAQPANSRAWVLSCLRAAPTSAQALLNRPDCPVKQPQLYAVLSELADAGRINRPAQRGGPFTIA